MSGHVPPGDHAGGRGNYAPTHRERFDAVRAHVPGVTGSMARRVAREHSTIEGAIDDARRRLGLPRSAYFGFDPTGKTATDRIQGGGR